jgi:hypothetical protein
MGSKDNLTRNVTITVGSQDQIKVGCCVIAVW